MKALILAAGQGTRLKYLTFQRPKPMLPIGNIPLLQHTVEWLRDYGITEIAINLFHRGDTITNHFGNGDRFGVSLLYSFENELLGTAGAAKKLAHFLDEPFIVVYGDVYTNLDLKRMSRSHLRHMNEQMLDADAPTVTMALYEVVNPEECGLVETDAIGRVTRFVEKPRRDQVFTNQAFSGVMVCSPKLLDYVPEGVAYDFGSQLLPDLLRSENLLYAEPIAKDEFVIDIGTLPGYLRALQTAASAKPKYHF
jgi:mannose-1-phosphate guanylyltransferase/phosphomannomutase